MNIAITANRLRSLRVEVSPEVLCQELDGEVVLLGLKTGQYYGLNKVGARIWTLTDQGLSIPEIMSALRERYAVSEERLAVDVVAFLELLQDNELATVTEIDD